MGVGARGGKTRWRNGNELGNVLAESGLVVFDGQQIMRSVFPDQLPGGFVLSPLLGAPLLDLPAAPA